MKAFLSAVAGILLCLSFVACEPKTALSVNQTSLEFDNNGGTQSVIVTANKVWSATPSQAWCKVSPSSGDGKENNNITLTISCDPNPTYDSRNCTVTVVCEELTATIAVTQKEGYGLIVSQTEFNLTNEAQTVSFEVKSNVDYLVSVDGNATSWIKVQSTKGLDSHTVVLAISENKDYDARSGRVIVQDVTGALSQAISVKQGESLGLFITKPEYELSHEAHTLNVEVNANVSFTVSSGADWISYVETKGLQTKHIVLAVAANDTRNAREGKVTVQQTGGALSGTISIRQAAADYIDVSPEEITVDYAAQQVTIQVTSNAEYKIDLRPDWVSLVEVSPDGTITLQIAENEGDDREELILFYTDNVRSGVLIHQKSCYVVFDDANFKAYCVDHFDKNNDGEISFPEAADVAAILCMQKSVKSTLGLEHFINLTVLNLYKNEISSIDLTKNTRLKYVNLNANQLSKLDLSHNPELDSVRCANSHLTSIDLSHNPALKSVVFSGNSLTEIDFSNNLQLQTIYCSGNALTSVDVSFLKNLTDLSLGDNKLTGIDVSKNYKLGWLYLENNKLTRVDVSHNPLLQGLAVDGNSLKSIDVSKNTMLTAICVSGNRSLAKLDLTHNQLLLTIEADKTALTGIDLSQNPLLEHININDNALTSLDVSHNPKLIYLSLHDNQVTELDVSHNPNLEWLGCADNKIKVLDVSNNLKLEHLSCSSSYLREVWLKTGQTIADIYCNVPLKYK